MAFSWQTPPSFAPATMLTAAQLNTISNDLNYLKERVDTPTGGGGGTAVEHKTSGALGPLVFSTGGVYACAGYCQMAAGQAFYRYDMNPGMWRASTPGATGQAPTLSGAADVRANPGETMSGSSTVGPTGGRTSLVRVGS